jgi:hypothetical protein
MMTPGDIVMMPNEMGGLRVQTTSPGLGAATVRIQGMRGRYTRFLADGLPLFGQEGGVWEKESFGRIGVEGYYTGKQRLEENPYRPTSRAYFLFGFLAGLAPCVYLSTQRTLEMFGRRSGTLSSDRCAQSMEDGRWTPGLHWMVA